MPKKYTFEDLREIVERLRGENGCPWDQVQTHQSMRGDFLEEAYEVIDAIDKNDIPNLQEELGDVLLHIVFHSSIEAGQGAFTLDDVIDGIARKMVYRHPHVFGDLHVENADEVLANWEKLKKKEKQTRTQTDVLKNVPDALPALTRAEKIQKKAANVGFDFNDTQQAMQKVQEEMNELTEAIQQGEETHIEEEFGDILFALVNVARFLKINPEFSLTKASKKFINRFECVENSALSEGRQLSEMTLEEMDLLWEKAKNTLSKRT